MNNLSRKKVLRDYDYLISNVFWVPFKNEDLLKILYRTVGFNFSFGSNHLEAKYHSIKLHKDEQVKTVALIWQAVATDLLDAYKLLQYTDNLFLFVEAEDYEIDLKTALSRCTNQTTVTIVTLNNSLAETDFFEKVVTNFRSYHKLKFNGVITLINFLACFDEIVSELVSRQIDHQEWK